VAVSRPPGQRLQVVQEPSGPQLRREASRRLRREYVSGGGPPSGVRRDGPLVLPHPFDDLSEDFGIDVYVQMLKDPDVNAAVNILKASILEDGLQLAPGIEDQKKRDYKRAVKIRDLADQMLKRLTQPINTVLWNLLDALAYGNKVAEQVSEWQTHGGERLLMLKAIKPKPGSQVAFVVDPYLNLLGLLGARPGEPQLSSGSVLNPDTARIIPPDKFCILTNRPEDCDPRGVSVLRPAYDPWWKKRQLSPEYLRYLAQFAAPSIWATPPEGAEAEPLTDPYGNPAEDDDAEPAPSPLESLLASLVEWRNGYALAVPHGTEVHPVELVGDGVAFKTALQLYSGQIIKAILTQQLATEEGEHQARSAASVHQDVLDTIVRQGKQSVLEMVSNQLLIPWVRRNWGDQAAETLVPVPTLGTTEHQDVPALMSSVAALMRAAYLHSSQLAAVDEMLGLPVRDWSQPNLLQPPPSPAPGEPSAPEGGEMGAGGADTDTEDPGAPSGPAQRGGRGRQPVPRPPRRDQP
jgi:Protein of unknown function (DUF935)